MAEKTICPSCARGAHEKHQVDYLHGMSVRLCRCAECVRLPFNGDVSAAQVRPSAFERAKAARKEAQ